MSIRFFFFLLATTGPASLWAVEYENAQDIEQKVYTYIETTLAEKIGRESFDQDYEVTVSKLDPRLRLAKCAKPLKIQTNKSSNNRSHITTRVACETDTRWSIFVPVKIDRFAEVAVAEQSLHRGQTLDVNAIRMERRNISHLGNGYIDEPERALGMVMKRSARAGELVKLSMVTQPKVVAKGDKVTIQASRRGLTVSMMATALENGKLGETISVKNNSSNRVLDALVVGPGRVRTVR